MRILTIPDLHGKNVWKQLKTGEYDGIIFLGDYVDSKKEYSNEQEINNLKEIIDLKLKFPDKVILLLGNHDIQYKHYPLFTCTNINYDILSELSELFRKNDQCFQAAYQINNYLWTHAGISTSWFNEYIISKTNPESFGIENLGYFLNILYLRHPELLATVGPLRNGHAHHGGIFWADKLETENDYFKGVHQFVGHTKVPEKIRTGNEESSIYYLDCLNSKRDFLVLEI